MGWNEPPGGKGRDPWGGRGNGQGPPDLEELLRKMQEGISGLFGRKPTMAGRGGSPLPVFLILLLLLVGLLYNITYVIDQQERGVVLRFGKFQRTLQPGLNFQLPSLVDQVRRVNVGQIQSLTHKAAMLTQDENIVAVEIAVQWRVAEPTDYVFNVLLPEVTLRQVAESAVRAVIGKSKLDFVFTEGRSNIAQGQMELMQKILDSYKSGIIVVAVEMQAATPPEEVKAAFDDAIKAREDEQRLVNEAEAYRNDIIPRARGAAARQREESNAYKASVIARAEGESARFDQLRTEYERAPAVTRQRLYLESMESVLSRTSKVLLDSKNSSNLMYLPLDRILENSGALQGLGRDPAAERGARQTTPETVVRPGERSRPSR